MNIGEEPKAKAARSAFQLSALWDREFVRSAYLTLLGREADPEGEALFTAQLRSGFAKSHILRALHSSDEGQRRGSSLPGLRSRLLLAQFGRIPVVGSLALAWSPDHSNSRRARVRRRLENEVARLRREHDHNEALVAVLAGKVERLMTRVAELESSARSDPPSGERLLTVEQILELAR